jgi:hypothetical protein
MKLSEDLKDFLLVIAFNFETKNIKKGTTINKLVRIPNGPEQEFATDYLRNYALSFKYSRDKDPIDNLSIKVEQWCVNDTINILLGIHEFRIVECFVYNLIKSINNTFTPILVGHYSMLHFVKFYYPTRVNNTTLITPWDYEKHCGKTLAQDFAIALFYTMEPGLFSPRWENIAKNILE